MAERFRIVKSNLDRRVAVGDVLFEIEAIGAEAGVGNVATEVRVSEAVVVEHAHGIHARPAALIARAAKALNYDLEVRARGRSANPKSAVALMSLGVRGGDEIVIAGFDAAAANGVAEIARVVRGLASLPAPQPGANAADEARAAPPALASRGICAG